MRSTRQESTTIEGGREILEDIMQNEDTKPSKSEKN